MLSPRLYQESIFATATLNNTLVVLPTGLGKTNIALMLAKHRLTNYPESKIVFFAPTKPLAEQHCRVFATQEMPGIVFTGETPPEKRKELWQKHNIIFSTPQGFENDVINSAIKLENVSLIVFDEAHRAVGDYAYVYLAKKYAEQAKNQRILALTASPGSEIEKIQEVCKNLYIDAVEARSEKDQDVAPYVQERQTENLKIELPEEFQRIINLLKIAEKNRQEGLKKFGIKAWTKKELLQTQAMLRATIASGQATGSEMMAISKIAEIIKIEHALELIETQGVKSLVNYFEKLYKETTKAAKNITTDLSIKSAYGLTQILQDKGIEHPKLKKLKELIETTLIENKFAKTIIFTQYRDSAQKIIETIQNIKGCAPELFIGQTKKNGTGLSQKKQIEVMDRFRDGATNIIVATSVAEEGLDVPAVDSVIFYEPIPSAIRTIQRRGRTARQEKGKVIVLIAKNTRDERYSWSARGKEKRMEQILQDVKKIIPQRQQVLKNYETGPLIIADYREKGSEALRTLSDKGAQIKLQMLETADYVLSQRTGIEIKKTNDFVNSIIDGRLLEQAKTLRQEYEKPLIIIEGKEDIYAVRNVHPNAIRGALAAITISFGIPTIQTTSALETAELIMAIAKREQDTNKKEYYQHNDKKINGKEQKEYLISALPSVGPVLAKELLKQFGTARNVFKANPEELQKTKGLGKEISKQITDALDEPYE